MSSRRVKQLSEMNIGIIGGANGTMGRAMALATKKNGMVPAQQILVTGRDEQRGREFAAKNKFHFSKDNTNAGKCDIVVIAVKPSDVRTVLKDICGVIEQDALVISIAAGVSLRTIHKGINGHGRPEFRNIVRCMPNTPGRIGRGITGWTANGLDRRHVECARAVLAALGREKFFPDERMMHVVTAVSGSTPAMFFLVMEALVSAAVREGMGSKDALDLTVCTAEGTAKLVQECLKHLAELRDEVVSPGGTTAALLYELEKGGLRTILADAIRAAVLRSVEMGKKEEEEDD